jgi:signal transduction histidine kinase
VKKWVLTFVMLFAMLPGLMAGTADSIISLLKTAKQDTSRVNLLVQVFDIARDSDPDAAKKYIDEAIALGEKLKFESGLLKAYRAKGVFLNIQGEYEQALVLLEKGIAIATRRNDKKHLGLYEMSIGTLYYDQGKYQPALDHVLKSVKWREELNDTKGIADSYIWMGIIHERGFKNNDKALVYYRFALNNYTAAKDSASISYAYANIGNVYYNIYALDSALYYQLKALDIKQKNGASNFSLAISHNNVANVYTDLKDYDKAMQHYQKSLELRRLVSDMNGIATTMVNIGLVYAHQKKTAAAERYILAGLDTAIKINASEIISNCYEELATLSALKGNYKQAVDYRKKLGILKDSLFNADMATQLAEMQTKYETEKKDLELSKKDLQLKNAGLALDKTRIQIFVLAFVLVAVVVFGYLFYNRYKLKQRQKLDAEIIHQQALRTKAIIEAEERERVRIAKDLHDGVGQQVSAVKMNLSAFEEYVQPGAASKDRYNILLNLVDDAVREVRAVSHNMMPNALLRFGLATAVREFIDKISVTGLLKCNLEVVGMDERLDSNVETVLYRVLQECVNNIIKHADAKTISIQLVRHEQSLMLMIEDDGNGFDATQVDRFAGIGIKNIISRVQFLNGTVDFDAHIGRGTIVVVEVPLV